MLHGPRRINVVEARRHVEVALRERRERPEELDEQLPGAAVLLVDVVDVQRATARRRRRRASGEEDGARKEEAVGRHVLRRNT